MAGLALITSAMIPLSSASRMAYHAYITAQENRADYRYHTDRIQPLRTHTTRYYADQEARPSDYSAYRASRYRGSRVSSSRPSALGRVSETNTTYVEATSRTAVDTKIRPFATRAGIAPWRQSLRNTGRYSRVTNIALPNQAMSFETFENDAFSLELPAGAQAKADDAHAFMAGDADIRIKRLAADTCDDAYGFRGCATNITRGENHALVGGKGRLISLDRVIRQTYKTDTVLNQPNLQTEVYTEEFTAGFPDGGTYTLYRYAAQDVDGGVYFIELKVPRGDARSYVAVADRIFDSFRIYTNQ